MTSKFYVDAAGVYLGEFVDHVRVTYQEIQHEGTERTDNDGVLIYTPGRVEVVPVSETLRPLPFDYMPENERPEYHEVPTRPIDGRCRWDFTTQTWTDPVVHYAEARLAAYPSVGDQLDVIWKEFNARRFNGEKLTQAADDMLGQILSIKKEFPKDA